MNAELAYERQLYEDASNRVPISIHLPSRYTVGSNRLLTASGDGIVSR